MTRRWTMVVLAGTALAVFGGCGSNGDAPIRESAPGTWELYDAEAVTPATTVLNIGVTRIECASGVTGKVLEPKVTYERTRILIKTDVEPLHLDAANCQANNYVRVRLELSEPIGSRDLVDASCVNGDASHTSFCAGPIRWKGQ